MIFVLISCSLGEQGGETTVKSALESWLKELPGGGIWETAERKGFRKSAKTELFEAE